MNVKYKILCVAILVFILTVIALQNWPPVPSAKAEVIEFTTASIDTTIVPVEKLNSNIDRLDRSLEVTDSLSHVLQKKSP